MLLLDGYLLPVIRGCRGQACHMSRHITHLKTTMFFRSYLCKSTPHCAWWWSGTHWDRRPDGAHNGSGTASHLTHRQVYNLACSGPSTYTPLDESHGWPHSVGPNHNTCVHKDQDSDCVPWVLQNNERIIFYSHIDRENQDRCYRSFTFIVMTKWGHTQICFNMGPGQHTPLCKITNTMLLLITTSWNYSCCFFFNLPFIFINLKAAFRQNLSTYWNYKYFMKMEVLLTFNCFKLSI